MLHALVQHKPFLPSFPHLLVSFLSQEEDVQKVREAESRLASVNRAGVTILEEKQDVLEAQKEERQKKLLDKLNESAPTPPLHTAQIPHNAMCTPRSSTPFPNPLTPPPFLSWSEFNRVEPPRAHPLPLPSRPEHYK